MMATYENDRFRSKITGNVYEVKKIVDKMIILESLNGTSQVLTELNNLPLFYESEQKKDENQVSFLPDSFFSEKVGHYDNGN